MNGICHMDIPTRDFEKAKKFYGELFNWEFTEMKEWDYMLFKAPDGVGGGFDKSYEISSKPGVLFYVEVDDIDGIIKKAQGLGGKSVREKTQISPDYGYMAVIGDLEGNQLGLWSKK
jgi:predicted enzyme related to lactoylglutathione lyase